MGCVSVLLVSDFDILTLSKSLPLTHYVNEPLCRNISAVPPIRVQKSVHDAEGYVHSTQKPMAVMIPVENDID